MTVVYGAMQFFPVPQAPAETGPNASSRAVIEAVVDAEPQPLTDTSVNRTPLNLPPFDPSHPDEMRSSIFSEFLTREN